MIFGTFFLKLVIAYFSDIPNSLRWGLRVRTNSIFDTFRERYLSVFGFFLKHSRITRQHGKGYAIFNSSLPLPPTSQTLRHSSDDYGRELASAHSLWAVSVWVPLVSDCKLLTTKASAFYWVLVSSFHWILVSWRGFCFSVFADCFI